MFTLKHQRGNFLLQALFALTLVFAFVPFLTSRLALRDMAAKMYSATRQIETAQTASRIYVRENAGRFSYGTTTLSGNKFSDTLEQYGLPLGYVPRTSLGNDISLIITKADDGSVFAYLNVSGNNMSELQLAELARRIGFYATSTSDSVLVGLALDDVYTDVVRRNETNLENSAFLADLDMNENTFRGGAGAFARRSEFDTAAMNTLSIVGVENGRKEKNKISAIDAYKVVFQSSSGEAALTLSRGEMIVQNADVQTVASFGTAGNITANSASIYDFSMTAGRGNFEGPAKWDVRGSLISSNVSFSVEQLEVQSSLNATRGQDVYISEDTLEYLSRSGIETTYLSASNVTLRDQTSSAIAAGTSGAVILDIRPAGTSVLPDALLDTINNDSFSILKNPDKDTADTIDCKTVITDLTGVYNRNSVVSNIVCQYVYWNRLEQRIDIKQCLLDGRSDCK